MFPAAGRRAPLATWSLQASVATSGGGVRFAARRRRPPPAHRRAKGAAMPRTSVIVTVDARLFWVVRVPEAQAGVARAASREQPAALCGELDALQAVSPGVGRTFDDAGAWVHAIALAVCESLNEPPELPYIGEPFGGEDGTD
jgi:hypothetical protein